MLILRRGLEQSINIGGDVTVKIIEVKGKLVSLGIEAPKSISVHREEIYAAIQKGSAGAPEYKLSDLIEVAKALRDYVDAIPKTVEFGVAMPGIDRDFVDGVLDTFGK
jgi:carbon storage regulator